MEKPEPPHMPEEAATVIGPADHSLVLALRG